MPFEKSYDEPNVAEPACIYLRSKAMYVTGQMNPEHIDEVGSTAHCWCNQTQHVVGPDRAAVSRPACVPGRDCFRATY